MVVLTHDVDQIATLSQNSFHFEQAQPTISAGLS
jgi:hypothetical protein